MLTIKQRIENVMSNFVHNDNSYVNYYSDENFLEELRKELEGKNILEIDCSKLTNKDFEKDSDFIKKYTENNYDYILLIKNNSLKKELKDILFKSYLDREINGLKLNTSTKYITLYLHNR